MPKNTFTSCQIFLNLNNYSGNIFYHLPCYWTMSTCPIVKWGNISWQIFKGERASKICKCILFDDTWHLSFLCYFLSWRKEEIPLVFGSFLKVSGVILFTVELGILWLSRGKNSSLSVYTQYLFSDCLVTSALNVTSMA